MSGNVTLSIDANTARYIAQLQRAASRTQQEGKKTQKSMDFGGVLGRGAAVLGRYAARLGPIAAVSAAIMEHWNKTVQLQDQAAGRIRGGRQARGRLLGLADTDAQADRLIARSDALRGQTGLGRQEADALQFDLESLGLGARSDLAINAQRLGLDPGQFLKGVRRVADALEITDDQLGAVADQLLVASSSSEASADEFAAALAQAAPITKEAGATFRELSAVLAGVKGDEIAQLRTGLRAVGRGLINDSSLTGSFLDRISQVQGRGLSPQEIQRMFGEGFTAFQLITQQMDSIRREFTRLEDPSGALAERAARAVRYQSAETTLATTQAAAEVAEERSPSARLELELQRRSALFRLDRVLGTDLPNAELGPTEFLFGGDDFFSRNATRAGNKIGAVSVQQLIESNNNIERAIRTQTGAIRAQTDGRRLTLGRREDRDD